MAQMSEEQLQAWWRDFSFLTEDEQRALVQAERDKQEGHTTRMLEQALEAARDGGFVHVVAADQRQADELRRRATQLNQGFTPPMGLRFFPAADVEYRLRGCSGRVFVDHYARQFVSAEGWRLLDHMEEREREQISETPRP